MADPVVYFGRFVDTPKLDELRIRTGAVLVSGQAGRGVISKADWTVGSASEAARKFGLEEGAVVSSKENGFFFPGFIDTHIHASQYPNVGIFGKSTLLDWLTTYTFPLESSLGSTESPLYEKKDGTAVPDPLHRAETVYRRIISTTLAHGTTTASYYATISVPATNILSKLAFDRGQRAYIGRVCMDNAATCPAYYRDHSTEESVRHEHEHIAFCRSLDASGELLAPIVTPRFAPSCVADTLTALGRVAREHDLRIQTHISENVNELQLVRELFPEHDSYAHVYDAHGLLTPRTILAHAIHLQPTEVHTIKVRQSKISHCPASNSALGSGLCPVRLYLDAGLDVGLGTDVSGGYSPSILEAARQACLVSRHVAYVRGGGGGDDDDDAARHNLSVNEALYLGTVGGAKVVGMHGRLGAFEPGMLWDVQDIDLGGVVGADAEADGAVDIFGWESWEDRVAKWVWRGDDRNVRRVWVGGRLVHERTSDDHS